MRKRRIPHLRRGRHTRWCRLSWGSLLQRTDSSANLPVRWDARGLHTREPLRSRVCLTGGVCKFCRLQIKRPSLRRMFLRRREGFSSITAGYVSNTFLTVFHFLQFLRTAGFSGNSSCEVEKSLKLQGFSYFSVSLCSLAAQTPREVRDHEASGSNPDTPTTSLRTTYRSQRLFYQKVTSHSFCRSSFQNRDRFTGSRFCFFDFSRVFLCFRNIFR